MKFDFNSIKSEDEQRVQDKFRKHGKGINMGQYAAHVGTGTIAKWEDLINPMAYSMSNIKSKMIEIGNRVLNTIDDEILGPQTVAFTFITERDEIIEFSWIECYTFLRSAFRYRKETVEYKEKRAQLTQARQFIEANKSKSQKMKEQQKLAEKLALELGM